MDIRVAAYGVIIRDGLILLSHWNKGGHSGWSLPGGGIEGDEHPAVAAVREIREETGYDAVLDRLLGIDRMLIPEERRIAGHGPLYQLRMVYRSHITGGELTHEVGGSSDEARWVDLGDLPTLERVGLVDIALGLDVDEPEDGVPRR